MVEKAAAAVGLCTVAALRNTPAGRERSVWVLKSLARATRAKAAEDIGCVKSGERERADNVCGRLEQR